MPKKTHILFTRSGKGFSELHLYKYFYLMFLQEVLERKLQQEELSKNRLVKEVQEMQEVRDSSAFKSC